LQAVAGSESPVGSRQLARELGLEPTRVNRLLKTLAALGLIAQTAGRRYAAGPGIHILAAQSLYASGLIRYALPVLESLHDTGYLVAMGVLWRDKVSYLYHAAPGTPSIEAVGTRGFFPAMESGIGRLLTAYEPLEHIDTIYGSGPQK
jgi:DNA-binding IclR family transcriptional regulator